MAVAGGVAVVGYLVWSQFVAKSNGSREPIQENIVISGRVYDDVTTIGVPGAEVAVGSGKTTTDAQGMYSCPVIVGTYVVTVRVPGYVERSVSVTVDGTSAKVLLDVGLRGVTAPPGPEDGLGEIHGRVTDNYGVPMGSVRMSVLGREDVTDSSGWYRFGSLPIGWCSVAAYHSPQYGGVNRGIIVNEGPNELNFVLPRLA